MEFQLINVEEMMAIFKIANWKIFTVITISGKNHQWMLKLLGERRKRNSISV